MEKPAVGLGTLLLKESAEAAVCHAVEIGCQLIDTGEHYGNLDLVGAALKAADSTLPRPTLVLKLSGLPSGEYDPVRDRVKDMLSKLGVERADVCLVHWPGLCDWDPTDLAPLTTPGDFQGKASSWEEYKAHIAPAWANMQRLKSDGLVGEVGTSNFYPHHLDELASQCDGAAPYANEVFIDSGNQELEFVSQMEASGIRVLAYRPVIYKPFCDPVCQIAERLKVSGQSVVLGWLLRRGIWPLVKCRGVHIDENINGAQQVSEQLTDEDMVAIQACDMGLKMSAEWFAKIWKTHNQAGGISEDDVAMLVSIGIEDSKARECLEACGGNVDAAMDMAFS